MDRRAIEAVADRFVAAWNLHDMAAFGGLFAPDADFVNVLGLWWRGRERIEAEHAKAHATFFARSRLEALSRQVRPLGDSGVALLHVRWRLSGQEPTPLLPGEPRTGVLTFVARHHPGEGWLIDAAHNTDLHPALAGSTQDPPPR